MTRSSPKCVVTAAATCAMLLWAAAAVAGPHQYPGRIPGATYAGPSPATASWGRPGFGLSIYVPTAEETAAIVQARVEAINTVRAAICERGIAKGRQALAAGKLAEAYRHLDAAGCHAVTEDLCQRGRAVEEQLSQAVQADLDRADAQYNAGDYVPALRAYRKWAQYPRLAAGRSARAKLRAAERDSKVQWALRESAAAQQYEHLEQTVAAQCAAAAVARWREDDENAAPPPATTSADQVAQLAVRDQVEVLRRLETIARAYAGTDGGRRAREVLGQLRADPFLMAHVRDFEADEPVRQEYSLAQLYCRADRPDLAVEVFQRIVAEYPDSPQAAKAEQELARLRR